MFPMSKRKKKTKHKHISPETRKSLTLLPAPNTMPNPKFPNPIKFDPHKVGTIKPPLRPSKGYRVEAKDLKEIFGIDESRFGVLPKRMVIPVLSGSHLTEQWWQVTGHLYLVEPIAWVPLVLEKGTIPASAFTREFKETNITIEHKDFSSSASATLEIAAEGSYMGISASAKVSSSIEVKVSKSATVTTEIINSGTMGPGGPAIHRLFVIPHLECRVIKTQAMRYTVNQAQNELKWSPNSSNNKQWWKDRSVSHDQLGPGVNALQWHPVPMEGAGLSDRVRILAAPQNMPNGEIEIITFIVHAAWGAEWFHYDAPWKKADNEIMTLAVPDSSISFRPSATWTVLPNVEVS